MELRADPAPWGARKILARVLERMMEAVHRYDATASQAMGNGITAVFGTPLAHEDHAVRACHAALRLQDAVEPTRAAFASRRGPATEGRAPV